MNKSCGYDEKFARYSMFNQDIFSERLLALRKSQNLTQQKLADIARITHVAIVKMEKGQRAASIEVLCIFADYFNVSLDYLTGRTDNPEINK